MGDLGSILGWERSPGRRQPIPVFLPGESQEQGRLVDYSLWSCKESDRLSDGQFHFAMCPWVRGVSLMKTSHLLA